MEEAEFSDVSLFFSGTKPDFQIYSLIFIGMKLFFLIVSFFLIVEAEKVERRRSSFSLSQNDYNCAVRLTKPPFFAILLSIYSEEYRSGHNEAVLKTVWVQAHGGSNPSSSAKMNPTEPVKRLKFGFIFLCSKYGFKFLPSSKRDLNP